MDIPIYVAPAGLGEGLYHFCHWVSPNVWVLRPFRAEEGTTNIWTKFDEQEYLTPSPEDTENSTMNKVRHTQKQITTQALKGQHTSTVNKVQQLATHITSSPEGA